MAKSQSKRGVNVTAQGHAVLFNGKNVRTPSGEPLTLPTETLAELVAREWRTAGANSLTPRLAFAAIDGGAKEHAAAKAEIVDYARHDLLCYPAEAPVSLAARQAATWAPLRDWAEAAFSLKLVASHGVIERDQPPESLAAVGAFLTRLDAFRLAALAAATRLFGSAVLGMALMTGRLSASEAHEAARIDEAHQAAQWGDDPEAVARAHAMLAEAELLQAWFEALKNA